MVSGPLSPAFTPYSALATIAGERRAAATSESLSGAASEHRLVIDSDRPAVAISDRSFVVPLSLAFTLTSTADVAPTEHHATATSECLSGAASEHPAIIVYDHGWAPSSQLMLGQGWDLSVD
jgi:hypothetical protein